MVNGNGSCRFRLQAPVACRVWGLGVQGLGVEGFGVLGFRGVGVYCLGFWGFGCFRVGEQEISLNPKP